MTYEEIVYAVRNLFENADARAIHEHIAVQVNIVGEGAGIFYFEVAERQCCVEPYDYYDHDCLLTTTGDVLLEICKKKSGMRRGIEEGTIQFEGNMKKLHLCLDNIVLPDSQKSKKKETKNDEG